jgi:antitoxin ParD1/3/4
MNVSLPQELKEYVESRTKAGYSTPSEYVRELIRQDQRRQERERLETMLLEGLNSGESAPMDSRFWADLRKEALAKLESRNRSSSRK